MAEETNDINKEKPVEKNRNPLKGLFNYQWIVKNIPFFLFLSALTVVYIANGHRADKTIRRINSTTNELKDLQYEYKTVKSEVMKESEEIKIVGEAGKLGLKMNKETPVTLSRINN